MSEDAAAPLAADTPAAPASQGTERWTALLLFLFLAAVYALCPERELHDARFALTTSERLVSGRGWDLRPVLARRAEAPENDRPRRKGYWGRPGNRFVAPYQLLERDGRWIYFFPPGTPLLSTPYAAAVRLAGISTLGPNGLYRYRREERLQGALAALLTAAAAVVLYRAARRDLPRAASAALALGAGLCTSLLSVASRNLWSHTWSVLVGAAVWLELARWEDGERRRPLWLGALLVAAFWIRPVNALLILGCALFVACRHRAALPRLVAVGAAGFVGFVLFSRALWGESLPPYYLGERTTQIRFDEIPAAVAGLLLSPARGLLSFTPLLLVVVWLLVRRPIPGGRGPMVALATSIVGVHVLFYAFWENWMALGATFGPRLLTDVVPWLVALAAVAWRAQRAAGVRRRASRVALGAVVVLCGAWSLLSHGAGAVSPAITVRVARSGAKGWTTLADWSHAPAVRVLERWRDAVTDNPESGAPGSRRRLRRRAAGAEATGSREPAGGR